MIIPLLLKNKIPPFPEVTSVLLVNSCSWAYAAKVEESLRRQFPQATLTYVLRVPYPASYDGKELIVSTAASNVVKRFGLIRSIRRKKYDCVAMCWTNESSFNSLKILGMLARVRSCLIFNENNDCFWIIRDNIKTIVGHVKWRLSVRAPKGTSYRPIINIVTLILLTPFGILFVMMRAAYYTLKKYMNVVFLKRRLE